MKPIYKHIGFAIALSIGISVLSFLINFLANDGIPTLEFGFHVLGWSLYFTCGLYLVNAPVGYWVQKTFIGFQLKDIIIRFLVGTLGSAVVTFISGFFLYALAHVFLGKSISETIKLMFSQNSLQSVQVMIWIALSIAITFQVIALIQYHQSKNLKEQKQKVIQISTVHESLKSQISSHFLFNSLNVLNGLIEEDQQKAQEFVGDLSSIYRYVLEQKDKSLVPLSEEIDFCKTYLELIKKRFEDGLEFEIQKIDFDSYQIVPLSLQILIENCIKHNRISTSEPLKIQLKVENDKICVLNNFQPKKQIHSSTGKGLQHIVSRYSNFTSEQVEIYETENEFIVKIPLLTEKFNIMKTDFKYTKEEYKEARKRVEEIQGFYWNLASYVIVNLFLTFLDLKQNGTYDWAFWPLIGWGIGVTFHAIEVFGVFNSSGWKNQMIQKELEKRKREREDFNSNY